MSNRNPLNLPFKAIEEILKSCYCRCWVTIANDGAGYICVRTIYGKKRYCSRWTNHPWKRYESLKNLKLNNVIFGFRG